jgi:hypothetical protein
MSAPGTPRTIAHYELLAKIGAGGMGEVYRARDCKLGREAHLLAAISHPIIAGIYGCEDGAIVMESRARRLPSGYSTDRYRSTRLSRSRSRLPMRSNLCGRPRVMSCSFYRWTMRSWWHPIELKPGSFVPGSRRQWSAAALPLSYAADRPYSVTPDGKRIVLMANQTETNLGNAQVNVVLNFFDEVKRKIRKQGSGQRIVSPAVALRHH